MSDQPETVLGMMTAIDAFKSKCQDDEYTDTQECHELLDWLRESLAAIGHEQHYLAEVLAERTGDSIVKVGDAIQLFYKGGNPDPRYYRLADYIVSSAVSGPSLMLVRRR